MGLKVHETLGLSYKLFKNQRNNEAMLSSEHDTSGFKKLMRTFHLYMSMPLCFFVHITAANYEMGFSF